MKTYLDNLRPFEKRLVVGVAFTAFIVFNAWFVVPHFSDWGEVKFRRQKAEDNLKKYNDEIAQTTKYRNLAKQLGGDAYDVPPEEQSLHFGTEIQNKAAQTGVALVNYSRITERTNGQFFLEKSEVVSVTAREQQLVDFLVNLGSGNSLIRVRDLGLKPDPPRQSLSANIKLVASYQKKAPAKATPAGKGPASGAKTGTLASARPANSTK